VRKLFKTSSESPSSERDEIAGVHVSYLAGDVFRRCGEAELFYRSFHVGDRLLLSDLGQTVTEQEEQQEEQEQELP